jgi:hypothetical protein
MLESEYRYLHCKTLEECPNYGLVLDPNYVVEQLVQVQLSSNGPRILLAKQGNGSDEENNGPNGGSGKGSGGSGRRGDLKIYEDSRLKSLGVDAHAVKESVVGKRNISRYNIAVGKDGAVSLVSRQRGGAIIPTEYLFDDLPFDFPLRK